MLNKARIVKGKIEETFCNMLTFTVFQVPFHDGVESPATCELYKVFKDHKNPFMQDLVRSSYRHCYEEEVRRVISDEEVLCTQDLDNCGNENVLRVSVVNQNFHSSLQRAIDHLIGAKLQLDRFGFESDGATSQASTGQMALNEEKRLSNKLAILVNDIAIAMGKLGYATYRGKVYKKEERSMFTYSFKCDARAFVNTLATNEHFKSRMLPQMKKVIELLSDPYCELFRPLTVDYDLIEINHGVCWSLQRGAFVKDAIEQHLIGKVTPRAFCQFEATDAPDAKYFREILENSLSPDEVCCFCGDFVKLLRYNKKRHKDKVPCLVGDANSGKTSLFFPILSLVHHGNVATVTKQRAFNKSMITPYTEVIFLDEATEETLDVDDWKTLTQGGYCAHDVKYRTAKSFINRCPMLITSQRPLNFGPSDQPAMDRRLKTYHFKSLPNPRKSASSWLKKHPMECLVWATRKAKESQPQEPVEEDEFDSDEERWFYEDGILRQSEKDELQALSLDEAMVENSAPDHTEDECSWVVAEVSDSQSTDASQAGNIIHSIEEHLGQLRPESLRYRQVTHMLQVERNKKSRAETVRREQHERRKDLLRQGGVSTQNAELVSSHPDTSLPSPVARDLQRHHQAQLVAQGLARQEAARKAFEGRWLRATEVELKQCCESYQVSDDPRERSNLKACIKNLTEKLKDHHLALGTFGTAEALAERKRVCTLLGLLDKDQQHLVTSVAERLPVCIREEGRRTGGDGNEGGDDGHDDDDDDESLFITPAPSAGAARLSPGAHTERPPANRRQAKKRKVPSGSQRQTAKPRPSNKITRYFCSQ